ncbi:basic proline-rich protein-like [Indicator indicator]|uniref:basic proline-rich protein-like n=1 Tax=Indicator indicator TaxID=1002788 RepID=UPI0023DF0E82|nr:basic proline-rich protein-like [Indicator indicator]
MAAGVPGLVGCSRRCSGPHALPPVCPPVPVPRSPACAAALVPPGGAARLRRPASPSPRPPLRCSGRSPPSRTAGNPRHATGPTPSRRAPPPAFVPALREGQCGLPAAADSRAAQHVVASVPHRARGGGRSPVRCRAARTREGGPPGPPLRAAAPRPRPGPVRGLPGLVGRSPAASHLAPSLRGVGAASPAMSEGAPPTAPGPSPAPACPTAARGSPAPVEAPPFPAGPPAPRPVAPHSPRHLPRPSQSRASGRPRARPPAPRGAAPYVLPPSGAASLCSWPPQVLPHPAARLVRFRLTAPGECERARPRRRAPCAPVPIRVPCSHGAALRAYRRPTLPAGPRTLSPGPPAHHPRPPPRSWLQRPAPAPPPPVPAGPGAASGMSSRDLPPGRALHPRGARLRTRRPWAPSTAWRRSCAPGPPVRGAPPRPVRARRRPNGRGAAGVASPPCRGGPVAPSRCIPAPRGRVRSGPPASPAGPPVRCPPVGRAGACDRSRRAPGPRRLGGGLRDGGRCPLPAPGVTDAGGAAVLYSRHRCASPPPPRGLPSSALSMDRPLACAPGPAPRFRRLRVRGPLPPRPRCLRRRFSRCCDSSPSCLAYRR